MLKVRSLKETFGSLFRFRSKYLNQEKTLEALEASLKAARREFNPSETPFQTQVLVLTNFVLS